MRIRTIWKLDRNGIRNIKFKCEKIATNIFKNRTGRTLPGNARRKNNSRNTDWANTPVSTCKTVQSASRWWQILVPNTRTVQVRTLPYYYMYSILKYFSPGQLEEIEKFSLSDILCSDSDSIRQIPENSFLLNSKKVNCETKNKLNLRKWANDCNTNI